MTMLARKSNLSPNVSHEKEKVEGVVGFTERVLFTDMTSQFIPKDLVNDSNHVTNGSRLSIVSYWNYAVFYLTSQGQI